MTSIFTEKSKELLAKSVRLGVVSQKRECRGDIWEGKK